MYTLLVLSSVVFVFFGLKAEYEEDLSKLLPSSGSNDSGLVFGNLKVKDKIFLQMTGQEPQAMAGYMDELMDSVMVCKDDIANTLYKMEAETALSALDFALEHVPSFVDPSLYGQFDEAIGNASETMRQNYDLIMNDATGAVTQMVCSDPLNLRSLLLPSMTGGMGYTILHGHLFSADSTVALAFISPDFQSFDSKQGTKLINHIEKVTAAFSASHPDVEVLYHGAPVRSAGNARVMKRDIFLTIGIALLIILVVICLSFNSLKIIWQNVMPLAYGTFCALTCMYWIKGGMSLMALGIGVLVLGVGISYCLHVIIHHRFVGNVEKMLSDEAKPVCLGCLTTIGAFLGLLFTKSELLRDFGLFATFLLVSSTLFALIFLPHFLDDKETDRNKTVFRLIDRINAFPFDRNPILIGVLIIVIVVGFVFTPKVQFDNNLKHIGYEGELLLKSEALYAEKSTNGKLQRYYAVVAPELDEALEANKGLSSKLDSLLRNGRLSSYTPVVSMLFQSEAEQRQRIEAWRRYWSEEKVAEAMAAIGAAAQENGLDPEAFELFRQMVEADYEPGNLYEANVVPDGLLCNFIEESDGKFLIFNATQMNPNMKAMVDDYVASLSHAVVVDPFYYTGNMITLIRSDFNVTLIISSVFVFLVLLLSFRSIVVALLAFLPMFLSWYVVQGWMAIFGLQFNLINIIISTFIFGIGVDYSIFVVQGLIADALGKDKKLLDYHKVAILFSAFTLIVVMISMLCAVHPAIKSIGICTLIGMLSTILITYSLQPLIFRLLLKTKFFKKSLK
jgi:predicted RND superfamily exporter protein